MLNKIDMIPEGQRAARVQDFVKRFKWKGPVFEISALAREGTDLLAKNIYQHVRKEQQIENPDPAKIDPRFVPDESDPPVCFGCLRTCSRSQAGPHQVMVIAVCAFISMLFCIKRLEKAVFKALTALV